MNAKGFQKCQRGRAYGLVCCANNIGLKTLKRAIRYSGRWKVRKRKQTPWLNMGFNNKISNLLLSFQNHIYIYVEHKLSNDANVPAWEGMMSEYFETCGNFWSPLYILVWMCLESSAHRGVQGGSHRKINYKNYFYVISLSLIESFKRFKYFGLTGVCESWPVSSKVLKAIRVKFETSFKAPQGICISN